MGKVDISRIFNKKFVAKGLKSLLKQLNKNDLQMSYTLITGNEINLTKDELIDFIITNYDVIIDIATNSFYYDIIDYILPIIDNNGEYEFTEDNPNFVIFLKMYLLGFPVMKDGKPTVVLPKEVLDFFEQYSKEELYKSYELNETIIQYTRGLLYYYGEYPISLIEKYLKEYEDIEINIDDHYLLLNNDGLIYGYDVYDDVIYDYQIDEIKNFEQTRKKHKKLNYYHLTKKQILEGEQRTVEEEDLLDFLENQLDMPENFALQGLEIILNALQLQMSLPDIKQLFQQLELSVYEHKQLERKIEKIAVNTRLWALKGHTKNEIVLPKFIKFPKQN